MRTKEGILGILFSLCYAQVTCFLLLDLLFGFLLNMGGKCNGLGGSIWIGGIRSCRPVFPYGCWNL